MSQNDFIMSFGDSDSSIPFLVIYQDFDTRREAEQLFDRMLNGALTGNAFRTSWVDLPGLESSEAMRKQAVSAAVEASMIIVAAPLGEPLHDTVRGWFESWLPAKRNQYSALALIGHPDGPSSTDGVYPLHQYLRNAAARSRMDFFFRRPQPESSVVSRENHSWV